jgi:hypothetical protein
VKGLNITLRRFYIFHYCIKLVKVPPEFDDFRSFLAIGISTKYPKLWNSFPNWERRKKDGFGDSFKNIEWTIPTL